MEAQIWRAVSSAFKRRFCLDGTLKKTNNCWNTEEKWGWEKQQGHPSAWGNMHWAFGTGIALATVLCLATSQRQGRTSWHQGVWAHVVAQPLGRTKYMPRQNLEMSYFMSLLWPIRWGRAVTQHLRSDQGWYSTSRARPWAKKTLRLVKPLPKQGLHTVLGSTHRAGCRQQQRGWMSPPNPEHDLWWSSVCMKTPQGKWCGGTFS